jgi:hypothetical protein
MDHVSQPDQRKTARMSGPAIFVFLSGLATRDSPKLLFLEQSAASCRVLLRNAI